MGEKLNKIVRIVFGLLLIFFGLNGFFHFMGTPEFEGVAGQFMSGLFVAGYIFPIVALVMLVSGMLFVLNKYVPFAGVLLFPISLNLILFHIFLDLASILFALIIFVLNIYMMVVNLEKYKPLFE